MRANLRRYRYCSCGVLWACVMCRFALFRCGCALKLERPQVWTGGRTPGASRMSFPPPLFSQQGLQLRILVLARSSKAAPFQALPPELACQISAVDLMAGRRGLPRIRPLVDTLFALVVTAGDAEEVPRRYRLTLVQVQRRTQVERDCLCVVERAQQVWAMLMVR